MTEPRLDPATPTATTARSASPPGVVVHHQPASTYTYVGSPGLAVLPDRHLLASNDHFGPGCDRDQTFVHHSDDGGATWHQVAALVGQWWSSLFVHAGAVYLIGATTEYGDCVIRRSDDGGHTWTVPTDRHSGLLRTGRHHCAPGPVLHHRGRLWRAMEDAKAPGNWGEMFRSFMMSAPDDADLLDAASWSATPPMARDRRWLDGRFKAWLEGNAVVAPDGVVINMLRVDAPLADQEFAALVTIADDGVHADFDPATDLVAFPGGSKKFTVRHDRATDRYLALVNDVPDPDRHELGLPSRNTLSLVSSADLRTWERHTTLLSHPDSRHHGFQYVDWLIDGDDLLFLSRTSFGVGDDQAHNHHDANYLTFHRLEDYRAALDGRA